MKAKWRYNYDRYLNEIEEVNLRITELEEEKKQRLEKKTSLFSNREKFAKELEEIRFQAERERIYYEELDKQRIEMAKIRHDYNNLITSVLGLIHMGREEEAKELIDELLGRMKEAEGTENAQ